MIPSKFQESIHTHFVKASIGIIPFGHSFPFDVLLSIFETALDTIGDDDVFDHIEDGPGPWITRETQIPSDNPRRTIPLVSKAWYAISAPYLYRTLILGVTSDGNASVNVASKLKTDIRLARCVQRLLVLRYTPYEALQSVLESCKFIRVLNFEPYQFTYELFVCGWALPRLQKLVIPIWSNGEISNFIRNLLCTSSTLLCVHLKLSPWGSFQLQFSSSITLMRISQQMRAIDVGSFAQVFRPASHARRIEIFGLDGYNKASLPKVVRDELCSKLSHQCPSHIFYAVSEDISEVEKGQEKFNIPRFSWIPLQQMA